MFSYTIANRLRVMEFNTASLQCDASLNKEFLDSRCVLTKARLRSPRTL